MTASAESTRVERESRARPARVRQPDGRGLSRPFDIRSVAKREFACFAAIDRETRRRTPHVHDPEWRGLAVLGRKRLRSNRNGIKRPNITSPVTVIAKAGAQNLHANAIAAGDAHSCAVLLNNSVKCWGRNDQGQLGDGTTTSDFKPKAAGAFTNAARVVAGFAHSCVRLTNGEVHCWGASDRGQCGLGLGIPSPLLRGCSVGATMEMANWATERQPTRRSRCRSRHARHRDPLLLHVVGD